MWAAGFSETAVPSDKSMGRNVQNADTSKMNLAVSTDPSSGQLSSINT
jgi:hypothetical protein